MSPLYFISLFFKYFGVILENVRGDGERYSNIEERQKNFIFGLYIVNLGIITEFFR